MEEKVKKDLAQSTFVEKLPDWLRWLIFLPAAIVVPIVFSIIQGFTQKIFLEPGVNYFLIDLVGDFIIGGGFVFVGSFVAPTKQFLISIILLTLLTLISFSIYLLNSSTLTTAPLIMLIHGIVMVGSGIYIVYTIHKEEE